MNALWSATLNPRGPNYERLFEIFGSMNVPLKSPHPEHAQLGPEQDVEVYALDLTSLTLGQRARLLSLVARKSGVPLSVVEREVEPRGFPIRAADVTVSISARAFV
jgi:hypothetical protein